MAQRCDLLQHACGPAGEGIIQIRSVCNRLTMGAEEEGAKQPNGKVVHEVESTVLPPSPACLPRACRPNGLSV